MKLLHIIASLDPAGGGPVEGVLRDAAAFAQRGVGVEIASLDPPSAPYLRDVPIKVQALGLDDPWLRRLPMARFGYSPRFAPWLRAHAGDYDRIIVNGLWNYASVGASRVLPGLGVPYFVYAHGMMDPWFARTYPIKHRLKQVSWLAFEGRLAAGAQALLFTAEEEMRLAGGQFPGRPYRGVVAGYGTARPPPASPAQGRAFQAMVPGLNGRRFLLFLSRIHPKKGCDLLIEAFARLAPDHPDVDLVIAGPDSVGWKAALARRCQALGIDERVHWPGMVRGDAKWGAYRAAEAFVLPSHQENFGIVVAEAMACGAPVVITDKINIWREVAAGGGVVATDDVDSVEQGVRRVLALTPAERRRMGRSATEVFLRHFELGANLQRLFKILAIAQA